MATDLEGIEIAWKEQLCHPDLRHKFWERAPHHPQAGVDVPSVALQRRTHKMLTSQRTALALANKYLATPLVERRLAIF